MPSPEVSLASLGSCDCSPELCIEHGSRYSGMQTCSTELVTRLVHFSVVRGAFQVITNSMRNIYTIANPVKQMVKAARPAATNLSVHTGKVQPLGFLAHVLGHCSGSKAPWEACEDRTDMQNTKPPQHKM